MFFLYSHSAVYHHRSHPVYWIYNTFFKPFKFTSGDVPCHAMIINWQRSMTMGILILPAGGTAWHPGMSHSLHSHFRYSLNGLFTTISNICSCEKTSLQVWLPHMCSYNYWQLWLLFMVLNVPKMYPISAPPICSEAPPWSSVPYHCQESIHKFTGHPTFRSASDNHSSKQVLLWHYFAIQNHVWWQHATICYHHLHIFTMQCFHYYITFILTSLTVIFDGTSMYTCTALALPIKLKMQLFICHTPITCSSKATRFPLKSAGNFWQWKNLFLRITCTHQAVLFSSDNTFYVIWQASLL
jgi:hypothetical protein